MASFSNGQFTTQAGAPQLPTKTISVLIPINQMVSSINVTGTSTVSSCLVTTFSFEAVAVIFLNIV